MKKITNFFARLFGGIVLDDYSGPVRMRIKSIIDREKQIAEREKSIHDMMKK